MNKTQIAHQLYRKCLADYELFEEVCFLYVDRLKEDDLPLLSSWLHNYEEENVI